MSEDRFRSMTPLINQDLLVGEYGDVLISASLLETLGIDTLKVEEVDKAYSRILEIPPAKQVLRHDNNLFLVSREGRLYHIAEHRVKMIDQVEIPIKVIFFHQGNLQVLDIEGTMISLKFDITLQWTSAQIDHIKSTNYDLPHGYIMLISEDNYDAQSNGNDRLVYNDMNDSDEVQLVDNGRSGSEVIGLKDSALIYKSGHIQAVVIGHQIQIVPIIRLKNRIRDLLLNLEWFSLFTLYRGVITHYHLNFDYSVREEKILPLPSEIKPKRFLQIEDKPAPAYSVRERATAPALEDEGGNIYLLPSLERLNLPIKVFNSANLSIGRHTKPALKSLPEL